MKEINIDPFKGFEFGENWQSYLNVLSEEHIKESEKSLQNFLCENNLTDKTFLDIGSGSGIHSLAARRLGAKVLSFDIDQKSVECTKFLKYSHFPIDDNWQIETGSIIDREYIDNIGKFDICYSWGVLHHTGRLWQAMFNAQLPLNNEGLLFVALYNDQGFISACWRQVKKTYCAGNFGRWTIKAIFIPAFFIAGLFIDLFNLQNPLIRYHEHKKYRGMSLVHDWIDWLGGYPYQPAKPDEVIGFYENLGLKLIRYSNTRHGFGNNQYLFKKISHPA